MAKRDPNKNKLKPVNQAKAKLRGVIAAARNATTYNVRGSHSYDFSLRKSSFAQSLNVNLLLARQELPFNDYNEFLGWADSQQDKLLPQSFKEVKPTLSSLSFTRETKEISLISEAFWLSHRLQRASETISEFLKYKRKIEENFWSGNLQELYKLFDELATQLGQSVWLVEARLSVEQAFKGLESQKKILEEIKREAGRGFIRFLSHRISMRNEMAVTTQRFALNLNSYIASRSTLKPDAAKYLRFKLCHEVPVNESDICSIIRFQQNHSIIDCYEGLVSIVQELVGVDESKDLLRILYGALLRVGVHDERIAKLEMLYGHRQPGIENVCNVSPAGMLLTGRNKSSIKAAAREFRTSSPKDVFQIYIAAEAISYSHKQQVTKRIKEKRPEHDYIRFLADVIEKNSNSARSYDFLEKTLRNFQIFPSCKAFLDIVRRTYDPLSFKSEKGKLYFLLNNSKFSPFDAPLGSVIESLLYRGNDDLTHAVRSFIDIRRSGAVGNSALPAIAVASAKVTGAFQRSDHKLLVDALNEQRISDDYQLIESRFSSVEVDALISLGEIRSAIRIFGEAIASGKSYADLLPFSALISKSTRWADLRQYSDEIALPIILHQIYKYDPNNGLATLRRTAVDSFLRSNDLERPSSLSEHLNRFGEENVVFFMRNLCAPAILDMCKCLEGTKAVDEERLRILGVLSELDPEGAELYESEILTLSSSLRIREGLKVVDGSRIHVDIEGISRWAHAELQESLSRYRGLVEAGVGIADDLDDVIKDFMLQSGPKAYLDAPKSEADDIVVSMLWQLRERFLFDKPHGLNSYLSKRVRHNSIAGYLRGALDKDSLITQIFGGKYRENVHWREILSNHGYSTTEVAVALGLLRDFGSKFDALTSHLKDALLHIKRPEYPHGLIDLPLLPALIYVARSALQSSKYDLGSWIEVSMAMFWLRLEPSLFRVREALSKDYKSKVVILFDNLRAELVTQLGRDRQCYELNTALNDASIELQNLIDRAADWFNKRQGELSKYAYTLTEVVDISVQSALTRHRSCKIEIEKEVIQTIELRADALVVIADILLVVIGNISDHSGCRESAKLKIFARMDEEHDLINFRFESLAGPEAYNEKSLELIEATRADIKSGEYLEKMAQDRRSGLFKVASIVQPEAGGRIEFGFDSPSCFILDLDLALRVESIDLNPYASELSDEVATC
ncbi:hypothetical protein IB260_00095 [Pseudomonas sp. PDM23]|uniref:hypothetical protein n=1 Tax=unclassified Pseudomonas TaxID=196821 RepID=UPI00177FEF83|nr:MULTISPECIES: hypothetical protein [unclassified Pseudomonas]MBD9573696.1 hypothetical protein [Pseudomonas sp. PDM23]MBD9675011.1 hypothetical protein [Pseudomonas sp. PDM21]